MRATLAGSLLSALIAVCGCTPHIHEAFDIDHGGGLTIDAKQRIILVTHRGGADHAQTIVCAEPSPDALSATAAALNLSGGNGAVQAELTGSFSEAAAIIGPRTATIQLLRDGLYRACEGYLNGVISADDYGLLLRNYDRVMVALLSIDAASTSRVLASSVVPARSAPGSQPNNSKMGSPNPQTSGQSGNQAAAAHNADTQGKAGVADPPSTASNRTSGSTSTGEPARIAPGIQNADQVIETIADYMLDNRKWLVGSCLTALWQVALVSDAARQPAAVSRQTTEKISQAKDGPASARAAGSGADSSEEAPSTVRATALEDIERMCGAVLEKHDLGSPRLFSADVPRSSPSPALPPKAVVSTATAR